MMLVILNWRFFINFYDKINRIFHFLYMLFVAKLLKNNILINIFLSQIKNIHLPISDFFNSASKGL